MATSRDFSWRRTTLPDDIARGLDVTRCARLLSQAFLSVFFLTEPALANIAGPGWQALSPEGSPLVLPELFTSLAPSCPDPPNDHVYARGRGSR